MSTDATFSSKKETGSTDSPRLSSMSDDNLFENDTVNIASIFDFPRADLLNDGDEPILVKGQIKCPEIEIEFEVINVNALIDTGSKITCVSREFF